MNTEENKLIAEFMVEPNSHLFTCPSYENQGRHWVSQKFQGIEDPDGNDLLLPSEMKFHSSRDWLMPVVEKIEHTSAYVNVKGCHVKISTWVDVNAPTKLEAVHKAVVEFIKWYNEQKH